MKTGLAMEGMTHADEFDPVASFENLIKSWWKIVLAAVIGGLLG